MTLPTNLGRVVLAGVDALRALTAAIRHEAERRPTEAELWLVVRDVEGLTGRLAEADEWDWGNIYVFLGGQDLGVLDEIIQGSFERSPALVVSLSPPERSAIIHLRDLLARLYEGEGKPSEPAA